MTYTERTDCRLCSGPLKTVLTLPDTPLANEYVASPRPQKTYPLYLAECKTCGHVQLPVVVDPKLLFEEYAYVSGTAASFRAHLWDLAVELYRDGHRTIVDIGSNDGTLIAAARHAGMAGLGVDPACNLAALASARCCLTVPAFFTPDIAREVRKTLGRPVDVVTCLNAFAHADDLHSIADGVRELIGDHGVFVFEVAYLLDVLQKNEIGTLYAEHMSHHHVAPLVSFFEEHGLYLNNVHHVATQGGSIRGYVSTLNLPSPAVRIAVADERERLPELLKNWPARVNAEMKETMRELAPYLGQGLAIYGAPARLTTYVYALGLAPRDVVCVFDDNPMKVGKFTPGLNWSIVHSDKLRSVNPEAVLISAWPYAAEIQAKFPDYRGKWILPKRAA